MSRDYHDSWLIDLLDQDDQVKQARLGWHGGQLRWDATQTVQGQGCQIALTLNEGDAELIDWESDRLRITYTDGAARLPHGIWLMSIHEVQRSGPVFHASIDLSDKCDLLNKPTGAWVSYPTGTQVTTVMSQIVTDHAGERLVIPGSSQTLAKAMHHPPDARWLDVVNALAETIKYRPLYATAAGVLASKPIVPVNQRPIVGSYGPADGQTPIKDWDDTNSHFAIPTGVRVYVSRPSGAPGWIGVADLPPGHPLSAHSRGKGDPRGHERLHVVSGNYASKDLADAASRQLLTEMVRPSRTITYPHPVNKHAIGDVAHLTHHETSGEIVVREVRLGVGAVATTTLQAVYPDGGTPEWDLET